VSTHVNTYAMIGVVLPGDTFGDDAYDHLEPYRDSAFDGIKHHDGLCVLYDGMNGSYVAIGKVIAKTEDGQGFEEPITFPALPVETIEDAHEIVDLRLKIARLMPSGVTLPPIGCHVISHYR